MSNIETFSDINYVIIETGGKQYQALLGKTLAVEKIEGEPGAPVTFDKVVFARHDASNVVLGTPYIDGAKVIASIVKQTKGPKVIVGKFQRRKRVRVKRGHRQLETVVRMEAFNF